MEFPVTIESQDDFDKLIGPRLERERAKFADHDELKSRAETAEAARVAAEQERDAATARATEAETKVGTFEATQALEAARAEVAKSTGVPVGALRGASKEELEAHAAELKPLLTAQEAPVIPTQGQQPEKAAAFDADDWIRSAARTPS